MRTKKAIAYICMMLMLAQTGTTGFGRAGTAAAAVTLPEHRITKMVPSKARFAPGEPAELILSLDQSAAWSGKLHLQIYHLSTLVAEGVKDLTLQKNGNAELKADWTPPTGDFKGYMVKAWIEGAAADDYVTAAVDVSSDWTHFPRYGYAADFPKETAAESDAKFKELSREYYINAYQFYDWMWRHDVSVYSKTDQNGKPVLDANGRFITAPVDENTSYTDLLGRLLYPLTIKQSVSAAQKYGSAAMAYEMNYAARENYQDFGVKPEWGLYNKTAAESRTPEKDQVGFHFDGVKPHSTALYLQDPGNREWQSYITQQYVRAINDYGFDGIHLDQWGASDHDYLLGYDGTRRYYSKDFDKIINAAKGALEANNASKSSVTFNMVGGHKGYSAVPNPNTKTDFDYSEIWRDQDKYKDLQQVVSETREADGGKAMVIAGYMNYKEATGIHYDGSKAIIDPAMVLDKDTVMNFGRLNDTVSFDVDVPQPGETSLIYTYSNGGTGTSRAVYIDGTRAADLNGEPARIYFSPTDSGSSYSQDGYFIVPHLDAGKHRVTLRIDEESGEGSVNLRGLTLGYFNEPSLRLMDAGLAALGAAHIEIGTAEHFGEGPNMLAHEYYPNRSKKMLESTKESMKEYYKFNAAYENLLFDSKADLTAEVSVEASGRRLATSGSGAQDTIWTTVRKNVSNTGFERYDVLHLINLLNNDDNWRNAANEPVTQNYLTVTYDIGITKEQAPNLKVYAVSPDSGHGMPKELSYTWDGDSLKINLPALKYWTMIYIDKANSADDAVHADISHLSPYIVLADGKFYLDVPSSHWAYAAIRSLTAKQVINGVTDRTFAPSAKVTRAQFAALLARALRLQSSGQTPFQDVPAAAWYASGVAAAYEAGIVAGHSDGKFAPGEAITRQEMAVMLAQAFERAGGGSAANGQDLTLRDRQLIAAWALPAVQSVTHTGLMSGQVEGRFAPAQTATRAEAAQVIANLLNKMGN
ncbi:dextranase [Paenibacillus forsythiae]|uniref:Dextranase n=1 Tax=Paenibacillus forsythiae TaxID=365616 RepID=A0ABU3HCV5_9BACL|nr:glycoside hydrolase family 66 protein [Paenibacillus forsythiae]MDT3428631.1 dextranase [Paenibacillus forsythiae]